MHPKMRSVNTFAKDFPRFVTNTLILRFRIAIHHETFMRFLGVFFIQNFVTEASPKVDSVNGHLIPGAK